MRKGISQQIPMKSRGSLRTFKNVYSTRLENLKEMDRYLDADDLPNLNQEELSHLNRSPNTEKPRTR
jgi:hypothetical protein